MEEEEKKTLIISARSNTNPLGNHKKNKGGIKPGVPDDDNLSSEENEDDITEQDAGQKIVQSMAQLTLSTNASGDQKLFKRDIQNKTRKFTDFKVLKFIGTGSFGKVCLATLNDASTNKTLPSTVAIKVLQKIQIIQLKQTEHIKSEKNLLVEIDHPFIVNILETFQDTYNLYLVFEYIQGGEIFRLLRQEQCFPNDVALFYITEIVLAIEHLHKHQIAYRDLKPENLLIARDGHIKITDFGFAKKIKDKTYTLCGTPEYLAPEVIRNVGHTHGVDWWSLGVLIFEMLGGYPPFYDQNPFEVYRKITEGKFEFPPSIHFNARKLISQFLQQDVTQRLGCMAGGSDDIKNHIWFRGVEWGLVMNKEIPPPWVPEINGAHDAQYFDDYTAQEGQLMQEILRNNFPYELSPEAQKLFENF